MIVHKCKCMGNRNETQVEYISLPWPEPAPCIGDALGLPKGCAVEFTDDWATD